MSYVRLLPCCAVFAAMSAAVPAAAQQVPHAIVEAHAGYAGFADELLINHLVIGGAYRHQVSPRVAVGPELAWMVGPSETQVRKLMATGNVWIDLGSPAQDRRVVPYLVAGVGLLAHRQFLHNEGTRWFARELGFTAGAGARIALHPRWYVAPEARVGSELHARFSVAVGFRPGR